MVIFYTLKGRRRRRRRRVWDGFTANGQNGDGNADESLVLLSLSLSFSFSFPPIFIICDVCVSLFPTSVRLTRLGTGYCMGAPAPLSKSIDWFFYFIFKLSDYNNKTHIPYRVGTAQQTHPLLVFDDSNFQLSKNGAPFPCTDRSFICLRFNNFIFSFSK